MDGEPAIEMEGTQPEDRSGAEQWRHAGKAQSAGYFWYFAAVGAFFPFAALYYRNLGFSGIEVGVLTALPSIGAAIAGPLLGAFADARSMHRPVLRVAIAMAALTALIASRFSTFSVVFVLIALVAAASAPIAPLLDSYGMTISEGLRRSYGSLRIWGSVGYMALTLLVGRAMGDDVSSMLLVAYAASLGVGLLATIWLPELRKRHPLPLLGGMREIRQNRPLMLLMVVAFLLSSSSAIMNIFLGIHIEDRGGGTTLIGLAFAISAASELPIIALGGKLLSRFGPTRLIALSLMVYTARFVLLSLITEPVWILPVQALHGLSFGAFLMASVTLAYRLADQAQAATAQALLTAMSFGFGSITGSLVGGALLDRIGTEGLFRGAAVMMVFTLAVLLIGNRAIGLDRAADNTSMQAPA